MQRWMQQKEARARIVGTVRSGSNRAIGTPSEDMRGRRGIYDNADRGFGDIKPRDVVVTDLHVHTVTPVKRQRNGTLCVLKAVRPVGFGQGRKARRAAQV